MKTRMAMCMTAILSLVVFFSVGASTGSAQQDKSKRPSPPAHAQCSLNNGATINVDYSSPRMRGRKIYGGLVPYGQVWRAGANEATTFVLSKDVIVAGQNVPAGSYTLFTIPEQSQWTLIISKKTGEWGIPYPGQQYDFARVPMQVSSLKSPVEDFTISFERGKSGCAMHMDWATTRATVLIERNTGSGER